MAAGQAFQIGAPQAPGLGRIGISNGFLNPGLFDVPSLELEFGVFVVADHRGGPGPGHRTARADPRQKSVVA